MNGFKKNKNGTTKRTTRPGTPNYHINGIPVEGKNTEYYTVEKKKEIDHNRNK